MISENENSSIDNSGKIVEISEISPDLYKLSIKMTNQTVIETLCRVVKEETSEREIVEAIYFDSEEFQRNIMMGEIDIKNVRHAIFSFRRTHSQPADPIKKMM